MLKYSQDVATKIKQNQQVCWQIIILQQVYNIKIKFFEFFN